MREKREGLITFWLSLAMNQYAIERGDKVELNSHTSPYKFNNGIVIEFTEGEEEIKILATGYSELQTVNVKYVIDIEKEYKILKITEHLNEQSKPIALIELSKIEKLIHLDKSEIKVSNIFSETDFELYMYNVNSPTYNEIIENPTKNIWIKKSDFIIRYITYNDNDIPIYLHLD
ncbi:hypothetical protein BDD43_2827 [Mucilaginibacter gracilis]|uniref:Uncharacterized protein n=1 Tax=Mucilaginibacter gracilis TaxID=423350 RepID=A0A495J1P8_9SPHI|nr:hypothetical protein [Mucilaginibacter gracilis]RKR82642.1 hypothetical protein BDD43_2827 [Mucilaginibacter gracilis]